MKLNIDKSTFKRGLIFKKELHSANVTVLLDEDEKQAILDFVNPKRPETNIYIMSYHPMGNPKNAPINVGYRWIYDAIKKGQDFSWKFTATTPIEREGLVQDFVSGLQEMKDLVMANAAASGTGSSEIEL